MVGGGVLLVLNDEFEWHMFLFYLCWKSGTFEAAKTFVMENQNYHPGFFLSGHCGKHQSSTTEGDNKEQCTC